MSYYQINSFKTFLCDLNYEKLPCNQNYHVKNSSLPNRPSVSGARPGLSITIKTVDCMINSLSNYYPYAQIQLSFIITHVKGLVIFMRYTESLLWHRTWDYEIFSSYRVRLILKYKLLNSYVIGKLVTHLPNSSFYLSTIRKIPELSFAF